MNSEHPEGLVWMRPRMWCIELFDRKPPPLDSTEPPAAIVGYAHVVTMNWRPSDGLGSITLPNNLATIHFHAEPETWELALNYYAYATGFALGGRAKEREGGGA